MYAYLLWAEFQLWIIAPSSVSDFEKTRFVVRSNPAWAAKIIFTPRAVRVVFLRA